MTIWNRFVGIAFFTSAATAAGCGGPDTSRTTTTRTDTVQQTAGGGETHTRDAVTRTEYTDGTQTVRRNETSVQTDPAASGAPH